MAEQIAIYGVILVLIGQIGAGKTTIGRKISEESGARLITIEDVRAGYSDSTALDVANILISESERSPVIFECTGASHDFEQTLALLHEAGRHVHVSMLECDIETAMRRIRERPNWAPPSAGGSWARQLRWTEMQLRIVPADLSISTERASPDAVARIISGAWQARALFIQEEAVHLPRGKFSFSQLASLDVCPLEYRYKFIERRAEVLETEEVFLGKRVHEALSWLYRRRERAASQAELLEWFVGRVSETLTAGMVHSQKEELLFRGTEMLASYYNVTFLSERKQTVDLERQYTIQLSSGLLFTGRIDRIALAASGLVEVIDYKTSPRKRTSRPRIPDLLQLASYGLAAMAGQQVQTVIARRLVVATGEEDRFGVHDADFQRVRLALKRWIGRLSYMKDFAPRPGRHCASCQFNPVCPAAAVPASPTSLRIAS
jgi:putative RecB family exonuclease